ncbi:MAG: glutamate racemase [Treponema sp.]|jgi:glutamate racemase|nr:glutamate racemase [Treponema sp.]
MDNRPVLFLDSGVGGIPYCRDFNNKNPYEEVYYLADRLNFPYGPREKEDIISILTALIEKLSRTINPKIIVLVCNSATVSALATLRQKFSHIPFVGTVPAIKPAVNASHSRKIGLLGTERTIEDPYNQNLANGNYELFPIAAPELVEFVEHRIDEADEKEKTEIVRKYIELFCSKGVDTLVLGCTHFLYLLKEFRNEAAPFIKVFDSLDGITKRIEFLLNENGGVLRAGKDAQPVHRFLLTGTEMPEAFWQKRARTMGFNPCLLYEL